jgi:hypothetical protein
MNKGSSEIPADVSVCHSTQSDRVEAIWSRYIFLVGGEIGQPPNRATISVNISGLVLSVVPISLASVGCLLLHITCTEVQRKCVFNDVRLSVFITEKKNTWGFQQFINQTETSILTS